ncbi:MAG: hypothetical protein PVF17_00930 [Ignavibacteria bacterium]|jgi:hypothetical protein
MNELTEYQSYLAWKCLKNYLRNERAKSVNVSNLMKIIFDIEFELKRGEII